MGTSIHCDEEDGCKQRVSKAHERTVDEGDKLAGRKARQASWTRSLFQASTPDNASTAVSAAFNQGKAISNGPLLSIIATDKFELSTAAGAE